MSYAAQFCLEVEGEGVEEQRRAPAKSVDHAVSCRFELGGVGVAW